MNDHHCLYCHGWLVDEWCDQCAFDWISFKLGRSAELPARLEYETLVEQWCDHPLNISPEPRPHQLVMPWAESQAPASPELLAEALRRQLAGCAFSLDQISEPSPN